MLVLVVQWIWCDNDLNVNDDDKGLWIRCYCGSCRFVITLITQLLLHAAHKGFLIFELFSCSPHLFYHNRICFLFYYKNLYLSVWTYELRLRKRERSQDSLSGRIESWAVLCLWLWKYSVTLHWHCMELKRFPWSNFGINFMTWQFSNFWLLWVYSFIYIAYRQPPPDHRSSILSFPPSVAVLPLNPNPCSANKIDFFSMTFTFPCTSHLYLLGVGFMQKVFLWVYFLS
jgi:hypothetical protein